MYTGNHNLKRNKKTPLSAHRKYDDLNLQKTYFFFVFVNNTRLLTKSWRDVSTKITSSTRDKYIQYMYLPGSLPT